MVIWKKCESIETSEADMFYKPHVSGKNKS